MFLPSYGWELRDKYTSWLVAWNVSIMAHYKELSSDLKSETMLHCLIWSCFASCSLGGKPATSMSAFVRTILTPSWKWKECYERTVHGLLSFGTQNAVELPRKFTLASCSQYDHQIEKEQTEFLDVRFTHFSSLHFDRAASQIKYCGSDKKTHQRNFIQTLTAK